MQLIAALRVAVSALASTMPASISGWSNAGSGVAADMAVDQALKVELGGSDGVSGASSESDVAGTWPAALGLAFAGSGSIT